MNRPDNPFAPIIPQAELGELKDMAREVELASVRLAGRIPEETARAIGDRLRQLNSYYSNLIEGHRTTIPAIECAIKGEYDQDQEKRYVQELCVAHLDAEQQLMDELRSSPGLNVSDPGVLRHIHRLFYAKLPPEHAFTHGQNGFTNIPVRPGEFRSEAVSVDGATAHGPAARDLLLLMDRFGEAFDPALVHGDDKLLAAAVGHHRLTWLHPFRDGNGRVARLYSTLFMAGAGINRPTLWSLSRGLSRNRSGYMINLFAADTPARKGTGFDDRSTADFCRFFFEICLDQIGFMDSLLKLQEVESRIDWYVDVRSRGVGPGLRPEAARLLRTIFMRGQVARGEAPAILNLPERSARRIVSQLVSEGLLVSPGHRDPLRIGLPYAALQYYFPGLYAPPESGSSRQDGEIC